MTEPDIADAPHSPSPGPSRVLFGALPLLAAVGPLLTVFRGLFAFRIACAFLIVYAAVFLLGRERWRTADLWLAATTASVAIAGLLGLGMIGPGSEDPYSEFLSIILGLTTALAARAWQRHVPGLYLALARGWVFAALFSCAIAAAEVVTGLHLPGYVAEAAPDPAAAFGNPNALAIFVVMANVWAIPVRRSSGVFWRSSTWVLLVASAPVLVLTGARLALMTWLLVVAWSAWRGVRRSDHGLAGIGESLVPLGAALAVLAVAPHLLAYASEISTAESSGSVREELTRQGLEMAWDNRGLPTWPGAFESLMLDRGDLTATAGLVNAHNMWVEFLVQYGALSLVLFLGWLLACVFTRSRARDEAALAVVTLLLLGIVDSSILDDASLWIFVITLAVGSRTAVVPATTQVPVREAAAP